jgi:hypothetical protein
VTWPREHVRHSAAATAFYGINVVLAPVTLAGYILWGKARDRAWHGGIGDGAGATFNTLVRAQAGNQGGRTVMNVALIQTASTLPFLRPG